MEYASFGNLMMHIHCEVSCNLSVLLYNVYTYVCEQTCLLYDFGTLFASAVRLFAEKQLLYDII